MERTGILFAAAVAICWGSADTVATFPARRQGTFVTTFVSLVTSVTVLVLFGVLAYARLAVSPAAFIRSAGLGLLTGIMAAVGYFSLYRGLELGPLAIVSPVTTADGAVGTLLAVFFLHEGLSPWQVAMLTLIFLGIVGASTNLAEVRGIVRTAALALFLLAALRRLWFVRSVHPDAAPEQQSAPLNTGGHRAGGDRGIPGDGWPAALQPRYTARIDRARIRF